MSFTDQKRFVITEEFFKTALRVNRNNIVCTLCNRDMIIGEGLRWVYANGIKPEGVHSFGNFFVCDTCDGEDVVEFYQKACDLVYQHMQGRGEGHWPVSLGARCLRLQDDVDALSDEAACYRDLCR
jgi:hypothetical protein